MEDELNRDHRDEHDGCKVFWPWLKWCNKYRYASQLVGFALEDIESLSDDEEVDRMFRLYNRKVDKHYWKHRTYARAKYICVLEGWDEEDQFSARASAKSLSKIRKDPSLEEEIYQEQMRIKRVWQAAHVFYAYGMFDMRTGKIKMSNLDKLK